MSTIKLSVKCSTCGGTGLESITNEDGNTTTRTCSAYGGDGWLDTGLIDSTLLTDELDWLKKKIKKILKKLEIEEED